MTDLSYNQLFRLIDDKKTFTEIGDPQNVLKTAIVINLLMIIMTASICAIPIPFLAPIMIILYIVGFCTLNIKFMRDFAMGVYQSDNAQIQATIVNYQSNTNKISNVQPLVYEQLESDFQEISGMNQSLLDLYSTFFETTIASSDRLSSISSDPLNNDNTSTT